MTPVKVGDRVKVVRGFSVGSKGTVVEVVGLGSLRPYDCYVRRDLAGAHDRMGYRFNELALVPQGETLEEKEERLLTMAGVEPPGLHAGNYFAKVAEAMGINAESPDPAPPEFTGGGVSYYAVRVEQPVSGGDPYTAECLDIIEALGMDYAEGNAFKAIWRRCAARMDKLKKGYDDGLYDAEKTEFYGRRMVEISKRRRENSA